MVTVVWLSFRGVRAVDAPRFRPALVVPGRRCGPAVRRVDRDVREKRFAAGLLGLGDRVGPQPCHSLVADQGCGVVGRLVRRSDQHALVVVTVPKVLVQRVAVHEVPVPAGQHEEWRAVRGDLGLVWAVVRPRETARRVRPHVVGLTEDAGVVPALLQVQRPCLLPEVATEASSASERQRKQATESTVMETQRNAEKKSRLLDSPIAWVGAVPIRSAGGGCNIPEKQVHVHAAGRARVGGARPRRRCRSRGHVVVRVASRKQRGTAGTADWGVHEEVLHEGAARGDLLGDPWQGDHVVLAHVVREDEDEIGPGLAGRGGCRGGTSEQQGCIAHRHQCVLSVFFQLCVCGSNCVLCRAARLRLYLHPIWGYFLTPFIFYPHSWYH